MVCTVLGYMHLSGESKKTGKAYDFFSVGVAYDAEPGYVGRRVNTLSLDPAMMQPVQGLYPPFDVDVSVDFTGRVISFDPV